MNKLKVGDKVKYQDGREGYVIALVEQKPLVIARPVLPKDHPNWPQSVPESPILECELRKIK